MLVVNGLYVHFHTVADPGGLPSSSLLIDFDAPPPTKKINVRYWETLNCPSLAECFGFYVGILAKKEINVRYWETH